MNSSYKILSLVIYMITQDYNCNFQKLKNTHKMNEYLLFICKYCQDDYLK